MYICIQYIPSDIFRGIFSGSFILRHLRAKQLRKKPEAVAPWFNERVKSSEIGIVMDLSLTQSLNLCDSLVRWSWCLPEETLSIRCYLISGSWRLFTHGFGQISLLSCCPEFWDLMSMGFDIFGSTKTASTGDTANCFVRAEIQSNEGHHPVPHGSFVRMRFCHIDSTSWKLVRCPKLHNAISDITASGNYFMYHCHCKAKFALDIKTSKTHFLINSGYVIWRQKNTLLCQGSKGTWVDNQFVRLLRISPTSVSFLVTLVTHMDWKFP